MRNWPRKTDTYADLTLGMSQLEVRYVKGPPQNVIGPTEQHDFGPFNPLIAYAELKPDQKIEDFDQWSYDLDNSRIDVAFDGSKRVKSIICFSSGTLKCPALLGIQDGVNEEYLFDRLGKPSEQAIASDSAAKRVPYSSYDAVFYLTKKRVYMFGLEREAK